MRHVRILCRRERKREKVGRTERLVLGLVLVYAALSQKQKIRER